jgi:polyribonucleotide nucleotidyltransferase
MLPFGAFVEYLPGREGMVHVSKMRRGFVKDPSEVVSIGDKVQVKVEERDQQGRINLSMLIGDDTEEPRTPGAGFDNNQPEGAAPEQREFRPSRPPFRSDNRSRGTGTSVRTENQHPLARQLQRESNESRTGRKFPPKKRFSR